MPDRVFLTGSSGFVGSAVLSELLARGFLVNALSHRMPPAKSDDRLQIVPGDILQPQSLDQGMRGCAAVIHLVGIIREKPRQNITFETIHDQGARNLVQSALRSGIRRFVHMSALGTRPNALSRYHLSKYAAEQTLRHSGLDWTIFRPSLIHGPGGEMMRMEAMWARKQAPPPLFFSPFMPYFAGKNTGRIQPVLVTDVARAFVDALHKPSTIGQVYELGGPDQFTWPQFHRICANLIVGKKRLTVGIPISVANLLCAAGIAGLLGFNRDQVIMSQEDNTCDLTTFTRDFGWQPSAFEPALRSYAHQL